MNDKHPDDLLAAFALDCLDPQEKRAVTKHLAGCPECRNKLQLFEETASHLAYAVPALEPPPRLKNRLLQKCRPRQEFSWFTTLLARWPRLIPTTSLAACVLAIFFASTSLLLWQQSGGLDSRTLANVQIVALQGTERMPSAVGQLLIDDKSGEGRLLVRAMQPLAATLQYQLWLIRDGQRTSGGVFSVAQSGRASLTIHSSLLLSQYDSLGVTIEPFGGSKGPTGHKVLGGKMIAM